VVRQDPFDTTLTPPGIQSGVTRGSEAGPVTTLEDRCRFPNEVVGVSISEPTFLRPIFLNSFSPRGGVWSLANATSS